MTIVPDCCSRYAVFKLIKLLLVLKHLGYAPGPFSMGKLTVFSKCIFFCRGFETTNHGYSIFLVFTLHLVGTRSELIGVDYSDDCDSKSIIKFDAHLGGLGELQTLLHNLCYCSWTVFNCVCIIDMQSCETVNGGLRDEAPQTLIAHF